MCLFVSLSITVARTVCDVLAVIPFPSGEQCWMDPLTPLARAKQDQPSQSPAQLSAIFHGGFSSTPMSLLSSWEVASSTTFRERQPGLHSELHDNISSHPILVISSSPFFIVDEQLCLHLLGLQKDLCVQSCYREANDHGIIYLYYYGTKEVTLVLECVPVSHGIFSHVFWPLLLSIFSHLW